MSKIALFGAAGAIGQSIAHALAAQGRPYRVVGRSEASLRKSFGADPLAEVVTWNPDAPESVRAAAEGIDTIVYLVGVQNRLLVLTRWTFSYFTRGRGARVIHRS